MARRRKSRKKTVSPMLAPVIQPTAADPDCLDGTRMPADDPLLDVENRSDICHRIAATALEAYRRCPKRECRTACHCMAEGPLAECVSPGVGTATDMLQDLLESFCLWLVESRLARRFREDRSRGFLATDHFDLRLGALATLPGNPPSLPREEGGDADRRPRS